MNDEQIADVIADSREYIEEHGWCRNTIRQDDGAVCMFGAVGMSQGWWSTEHHGWKAGAPEKLTQVARFLERLLPVEDPSQVYAVTEWNDEVAKNKQEVLDFLAKAEKVARFGSDPDA